MDFTKLLENTDLRYERKFTTEQIDEKSVALIVKQNPACFSEIYNTRKVNNIYFDTLALSAYTDNIDGNSSRVKFRIRW